MLGRKQNIRGVEVLIECLAGYLTSTRTCSACRLSRSSVGRLDVLL